MSKPHGNFYDRYIATYLIDLLCGIPPVQRERAKVVPRAQGKVLEVGIGTGRNMEFYNKHQLAGLCGVDPGLHRLAEKRAKAVGIDVELIPLSAEKIPAAEATFDTVLSTFTLCTIPDAHSALKEMHRVLKPGGRLLFCEHGVSPEARVRRWQDRLTPYWKPLAGGCHLNRDIPRMLKDAGFEIEDMDERYVNAPKIVAYVYSGSAVASPR